VFITIKEDLSVSVGDAEIPLTGLLQEVEIVTRLRRDTRLYLRADKAVPYGDLMSVMNKLRVGGYLKVGLVGLEAVEAEEPVQ
jgi:biopolymer transport protein ExbD